MRLLVNVEDLRNVNLKKFEGLDITLVGYGDIDDALVEKVEEVANQVTVEKLRNKMQMITFLRLQLMDNTKVFFSEDKNMLNILCRKNCANDLDLTLAYIMGKIRLGKLKETTEESEVDTCVIVDFEQKKEDKTEKDIISEDSLRAKLDRVRAFREAK